LRGGFEEARNGTAGHQSDQRTAASCVRAGDQPAPRDGLREGAAALKAENAQLRLELSRLAGNSIPSGWPAGGADAFASWEVALPSEVTAPRAARIALAGWIERCVPPRVLEDAQLLASELVTNSVSHADVETADLVAVAAELAPGTLRLHVEDSGTSGLIAPRTPDLATGTGFGLNIVAAMATQWGVSRAGGTRVWAELTWSA
jgi:anti-sigma regulatory factor (Ser/Thr protein kinase)